jgi:glucokinase
MLSHVLAGDIGGTKTNLALYQVSPAGPVESPQNMALVREASFPSTQYTGLESVVAEFMEQGTECVRAGAFGIAGPVLDGRVMATNLPWKVESESLAQTLGGAQIQLMNDLEATAYGALHAAPNDIQMLNEGLSRPGNCAVIAAGTGLGQTFLFWDGSRYIAAATEGGHVDFAPRNEREDLLLRYLRKQYATVSYERIVSGPGLVQICNFFVDEQHQPVAPHVRERLQTGDPAAVIGEAGVTDSCPTCTQAVELFLSIYGAQAGNLALTIMGLGGVYIGGGIITKLLPKVQQGGFLQAFQNKGRFSALMKEIPVRVLLNPKTSQIGAAQAASALVS